MSYELKELKREVLKLSNGKANKICIFGTGAYGNKLYYDMSSNLLNIDYFSDNDCNKWGHMINSIPCISPKRLEEYKDEILIIVSIQNPNDVITQLKQNNFKYIIDNEVIYNIMDNTNIRELEMKKLLKICFHSKEVIDLINQVNEIISDIYNYYNEIENYKDV